MEIIGLVAFGFWAWIVAMAVLTILWGLSQLIRIQTSNYEDVKADSFAPTRGCNHGQQQENG